MLQPFSSYSSALPVISINPMEASWKVISRWFYDRQHVSKNPTQEEIIEVTKKLAQSFSIFQPSMLAVLGFVNAESFFKIIHDEKVAEEELYFYLCMASAGISMIFQWMDMQDSAALKPFRQIWKVAQNSMFQMNFLLQYIEGVPLALAIVMGFLGSMAKNRPDLFAHPALAKITNKFDGLIQCIPRINNVRLIQSAITAFKFCLDVIGGASVYNVLGKTLDGHLLPSEARRTITAVGGVLHGLIALPVAKYTTSSKVKAIHANTKALYNIAQGVLVATALGLIGNDKMVGDYAEQLWGKEVATVLRALMAAGPLVITFLLLQGVNLLKVIEQSACLKKIPKLLATSCGFFGGNKKYISDENAVKVSSDTEMDMEEQRHPKTDTATIEEDSISGDESSTSMRFG